MKYPKEYQAYIISIKKNKIKIYIPSIDLEHKFIIISKKLFVK